jgi:spore germination protein YaaH/flagellar hook assembly protein FlgD
LHSFVPRSLAPATATSRSLGRRLVHAIAVIALAGVLAAPNTVVHDQRDTAATAPRTASSVSSVSGRVAPVIAGDEGTSVPARFTPRSDGAPSSQDARGSDPGDSGGLAPGIQYEEAQAHANDRIHFTPGGRVGVPFRPRADDGWPVDGKAPRALPAGGRSGEQIARSPAGETDPAPAQNTDVDQPSSTDPLAADTASLSTTNPLADQSVAASSALRRQVFGFLPYWNLNDSGMVLNYNVLSTIAYFSVGADRYGNLRKTNSDGTLTTGWAGWTSSRLSSIMSAAHQKGTRVVLTISVFAWTSSQASTQAALLASSTARLNLARQVAKAVHDRGADGVNLDFEPIVSGYADEFTAFVRTLRTQLNSYATGYQLTFDTTGRIGNYPIEAATAPGGADAIFIMGYDYRTAGSSIAGSIDPLTGPAYDLTDTVAAFTSRVAPSKLILGVPYYGRAWSTVSGSVRSATHSGTKYGTSVSVNYENVVPLISQYGRKWDSVEQSPWIAYKKQNCTTTYGCVTTWRQVYYDDALSLGRRYDLVNRAGLRGVGMWALGYDGSRTELWQELGTKFLHDTTPPLAGIRNLAPNQRDAGFIVSWRAVDDSNIARYDVQVSADGGAWGAWLTGTTATSDVYLGRDGHSYAFRARATDSHGNVSGWNVASVYDSSPSLAPGGFGRVRVDGLAVRTGHDTSAASVGTLNIGDILAITGGPVAADGYAWYQFTGPIAEWQPVAYAQNGVWVATSSSTTTYVSASVAPNSTLVDAGITGLGFSDGGLASLGSSAAATMYRAFSPNGDGSRDRLRIRWTNTVAFDSVTLKVWRVDGTLAGTISLPDISSGAQVYDWNGTASGTSLADGRYVLQLVGVAGTTSYTSPSARPVTPAQVATYAVTIDRVAPTITASSISSTRLSPDGDGRLDTLTARIASTGGATGWRLTAAPVVGGSPGAAVRTISGAGASPSVVWNGRNDAGTAVPDGAYQVTLGVADPAGNVAARSWSVIVRSQNPAIVESVAPASFSPNGDGADDRVALRWSSDIAVAGTARITRGTTLVRSWTFSSRSSLGIAWDGHDRYGHMVADGRYSFTTTGTDAFGNRTSVSAFVTVDRTIGFLRWSPTPFYPQDGDSLLPSSALTFRLTRGATLSLRILDSSGAVVRTVWSNASKAAGSYKWAWNGKSGTGAYVPQGRYVAELTATSSLGTSVLRRAIYASAFTISPSATSLHAGQTLTITFRSVERLSTRPVVTFTQSGRTGVTKTATLLSNGSYRVSFLVASGGTGPATVALSAKDSLGHTNRGSLTVSVS